MPHSFENIETRPEMLDFDGLLRAITSGKTLNSEDLLPFICQESIKDRLSANFKLAEAYFVAAKLEEAKIFIQRAWEFSGFMEECLPLYLKIHARLNDTVSIREAYKQIGMKKAHQNKIGEALEFFNSWQYTDAVYKKIDKYHYDYDILNCISNLSKPHSFSQNPTQPITNRKIRLAYLMFGMTHVNSVIVKHSLSFAEFHDKTLFEVSFFIPERNSLISKNKEAKNHIKNIEHFQCGVTVAPNSTSEEQSLIQLAASIHDFSPDVLVTNAALADFKHYFIVSLRPAPLVIGLCQGPPPQFIAPSLDWSISWTKHPMIDCPTSCSLVTGGTILPTRKFSTFEAKTAMNIPEDSFVLMSCGRPEKFQDQDFLKTILEVVRQHENVHLVVVGVPRSDFLDDLIPQEAKERVKILGWQNDFLLTLSMADVLIDTYPSGGGVTILDAMALGIPVISFKNNYSKVFSQTDWSPAEEFMGVPELVVERGDFLQFQSLLSKLITDDDYRFKLAELCIESIHRTSGDPLKMVQSCEEIYLGVLSSKLNTSSKENDFKDHLPPPSISPPLFGRVLRLIRRKYRSLKLL